MAKNWTMAEAANVIATNGINNEELMDFGRRFPVTTNLITAALAGDKEAIKIVFGAIPAYVTMGKMEKNFKDNADSDEEVTGPVADEDSDEDEVEDTEVGEKDFSEMNNKQLKAELRKAGFKSADIKGKNKAAMLEMLAGAAPATTEADDEEEEDEAEEAAVDYSKMSAKELYKICKSKGIDVEQKKPAKYYIDAINAAEGEDEEEADEWEETEEEAPMNKPAKATKTAKATAKNEKSKKSAKAAKSEDEEWDI